jgi:hypothetical protein
VVSISTSTGRKGLLRSEKKCPANKCGRGVLRLYTARAASCAASCRAKDKLEATPREIAGKLRQVQEKEVIHEKLMKN